MSAIMAGFDRNAYNGRINLNLSCDSQNKSNLKGVIYYRITITGIQFSREDFANLIYAVPAYLVVFT